MRAYLLSLAILIFFPFLIISCATSEKSQESNGAGLPEEIRLKEDRSALEELRKDIPAEVQAENDEIAFILNLMTKEKSNPTQIQSRFNTALRKKRQNFDKKERKLREAFNREQKKQREEFLANLKKERKETDHKKLDREARQAKYTEYDVKRREFFNEERDERREFESLAKERRSEFDSHIREVRGRFNQEYKTYVETYYDKKRFDSMKARLKKEEAQQSTGSPAGTSAPKHAPQDPDLTEFDNIPKDKIPLKPSEADSN